MEDFSAKPATHEKEDPLRRIVSRVIQTVFLLTSNLTRRRDLFKIRRKHENADVDGIVPR